MFDTSSGFSDNGRVRAEFNLNTMASGRRRPTAGASPWRRRAGVAVLTGSLTVFTGCRPAAPPSYQGYLEAEFVYVAAPLGGTLTNLAVARGDTVAAGAPLFELEHAAEADALREAGERLAQAEARLANLRKGRRPSEIEALEARLNQAKAELKLAEDDWQRLSELFREAVISPAELERTRTQREAGQAQVAASQAELETARLGAREDEILAAQAEVEALRAARARAQWAVDQKRQRAAAAGRVQDTLYRVGEFVGPGLPVVSLLPPENIRARFFVPEREVATIQPGRTVLLQVDGRATPVPATISYVSSQAEFTPPVLYSQENRAKLVFMVEARPRPADSAELRPGQPVDVTLPP